MQEHLTPSLIREESKAEQGEDVDHRAEQGNISIKTELK